ncbi:hypothetical protein BDW22DRAFT_1429425 [Trametopsis cervina]|nr:hypothetical protein BDW22DRAFT_1429425 [Trametopsis cervina]
MQFKAFNNLFAVIFVAFLATVVIAAPAIQRASLEKREPIDVQEKRQQGCC